MVKNFVVYGTDYITQRFVEMFDKALDMIDFYISPNKTPDYYFTKYEVYAPDQLPGERLNGKTILMLESDTQKEREGILHTEGLERQSVHFLSKLEWVTQMMEDPSMRLAVSHIRLDICTMCQLDCVSCYMRRDRRQTTGTGYVHADQFKQFLEDNPGIREIEISNSGEPFVHPELHQILNIAREHGVGQTCYNGTNFNYVTEEVLEDLVSCGMEEMTIALDGARQETYEIYRRKGNFDRVIENIKKLNEIKKRSNSPFPKLTWQFIVMSHNYDDMELAKKMAEDLDMKITFNPTWSPVEAKRLADMLAERNAGKAQNQPKEDSKEKTKNAFTSFCRDLLYSPQFNWDGRLLGCCKIYRSDWDLNCFENSIDEIMNSPKYRGALIALLKGTEWPDDSIPCATCKIRPMTLEQRQSIVNFS